MKQDNAIEPRITIADRFEEARALFLQEKAQLPVLAAHAEMIS